MNTVAVVNILLMLPGLITGIESVISEKGKGVEKLEMIINAITPLIPPDQFPDFVSNVLPKIKTWVGILVSLYNVGGLFRK